jgi:hypothetical protein
LGAGGRRFDSSHPDQMSTDEAKFARAAAQAEAEPVPTNAHMREVAERFLAGKAADRRAAVHLAYYVLALTEDET